MPQVGNRKFAYTAAGIRQAMKAAKNMKRRPTSGRPLPRPRPGTMRPRAPRVGSRQSGPFERVNGFGNLPLEEWQRRRQDAIKSRGLVDQPRLGGRRPSLVLDRQPNRKEYQGPVQLGPRPTVRPKPNRVPQRPPGWVPDRDRRPRPTSSTSSPEGQMNGIEALAALSQQFGGGQGMNIGGGPYGPPAPAPRQPNPNIPDRDPNRRPRRMNIRFPRN